MSGSDAAQRESTRDGRRGAARAEGGRAPEAAVFLFSGCPRRRKPCGPEHRPPQRVEARKRRASGAVASMDRSEAPGLRAVMSMDRGETPVRGLASCPASPPSTSALPRRSCRHPVCGRVSRPRRAGGAYNTELVAAKGRGPDGGRRPAARGTAGKNFLKKVLDTAERAR